MAEIELNVKDLTAIEVIRLTEEEILKLEATDTVIIDDLEKASENLILCSC